MQFAKLLYQQCHSYLMPSFDADSYPILNAFLNTDLNLIHINNCYLYNMLLCCCWVFLPIVTCV